jgi:hypothetical protein
VGESTEIIMGNKIQKICGNCRLYDPQRGECRVVILWEGERRNLPVEPQDQCFYEQEFGAGGSKFIPADEIKQVRFWVEDPTTGEKTNKNGTVKVEYPEGFFGGKCP